MTDAPLWTPVRGRLHRIRLAMAYRTYWESYFRRMGLPRDPIPWRFSPGDWLRWEGWLAWQRHRTGGRGLYSHLFADPARPRRWIAYGDIWIDGPIGYLGNIGVEPEARGKGWGTWFFEFGLEILCRAGCREVRMHIDPSNATWANLGRRLGFEAQSGGMAMYRIHGAPPPTEGRAVEIRPRRWRNAMAVYQQRRDFRFEGGWGSCRVETESALGFPVVSAVASPIPPVERWPALWESLAAAGKWPSTHVRLVRWEGNRLEAAPILGKGGERISEVRQWKFRPEGASRLGESARREGWLAWRSWIDPRGGWRGEPPETANGL